MQFRFFLICATLLFAATADASDALMQPGRRLSIIETEHLMVFVPHSEAERLGPIAARAEEIYVKLARDAHYAITRKLYVLFSNDREDHNGFSMVVPFPLVQVELAPAEPESFIFDGEGHLERTLVHEFTHHISNDRNHGFRGVLEKIFGRILPIDELSLIVAYLSWPAHMTMPPMWQEGLAQWAETEYADPSSPWSGRGRDSLTHMVWRLDAAAGAVPSVDDWRLSYIHWPFGSRVYLYGLAYLRYLTATYGDRADVWRLIDSQALRWAFAFNGGVEAVLGKSHAELISEARTALLKEQLDSLQRIRAQPVTTLKRLTPEDTYVAAPAWTREGTLYLAVNTPYDRPHYAELGRAGAMVLQRRSAWALGPARSLPDGTLIYAEVPGDNWEWMRSRIYLLPGGKHPTPVDGKRMIEPDAKPVARGGTPLSRQYRIAAVQLSEGGTQRLMTTIARRRVGLLDASYTCQWHEWPTEGRPWSPTFRPDRDGKSEVAAEELAWVETDPKGSRIVLAPLADATKRTILAEVKGRILHPVWAGDGSVLYFCSDISGVANAYVVDPAAPGKITPLTNTIGGIIACVPSFDGKKIALIDHDQHGPFAAVVDSLSTRTTIPEVARPWPAPLDNGVKPAAHSIQPDAKATATAPRGYHGLPLIRPLFWTPTTFPVEEGGIGALGVAADPVLTHIALASAGVGPVEAQPVGMFAYGYGGWLIDIEAIVRQSERTFADQIVDTAGNEFDYSERVANAEFRLGYGMIGFRRRLQAWAATGVSDYRVVSSSDDEYDGRTLVNTPAFRGTEQYVEGTVAYDDATFFPTSYAPENGSVAAVTYRRSGFGGELDRDRVLGRATVVVGIWPPLGQQLVLGGELGWSRGDETLQGAFSVGGALGLTLPRGYVETQATGSHLIAGSAAYRTPLWRQFKGFGSSPFAHRQVVLEAFFDAAKVSDDRINGDGQWFRSVGGELHDSWEFYGFLVQPGLGVAQQLDGDEDTVAYLSLGFRI